MRRTATTALLAIGGTALAQPAITIEVEDPVLMPGESTVVTMYAGFDPSDYAMAEVGTDLLTSVGSDGWRDAVVVGAMDGSRATPGTPSVTGYDGIEARQPNFGLSWGYADPSNPIAFWQAVYTAPVDVRDPMEVELSTLTRRYDVYWAMDSVISESRLADLTEGAATIRVIPAPASALMLSLGLAALCRRREPDRTETRDA
ncbi:MAG: hypothetical protein RIE77_05010 [Phycisphaerales bacterium]|jgi:hypothetical protein